MSGTLGVIDIRWSNFESQWLKRRLGGKSLLEWVIRRVDESARLSGIVIAADSDLADDELWRMIPASVPVFRQPAADPLARFVSIVDAHASTSIVRISATNPFVDAALIDRLISTADEHPSLDYISYVTQCGKRALLSAVGMFAEWLSADALRQADCEARHAADRQQVTRYIYSRPEQFMSRLIPAPRPLDGGDVRLTIENEEDWEHAEAIFEALGHDRLDWQEITGFLQHQPGLRQRMAALNRQLTMYYSNV